MKSNISKAIAVAVSMSMVCMAPLPALADQPIVGEQAVSMAFAPTTTEEAERDAAVQDLVSSSLKAGAAVEELEQATGGAVSIEFDNLPEADIDEVWAEDAQAYIDDLAAQTPQTLAADDEQAALMEAQGNAVYYAAKMADWSVNVKHRSNDIKSEAVYMYMSHYIDIGNNYWSAGSLEYLLDGSSRSNTQPFLSQWLLKADRDAYSTYLATTQGTKQLAKVGDVAAGALGLGGTLSEIKAASGSLGKLSEQGYRCKASVAGLSLAYDGAMLSSDLQELQARYEADRAEDPTKLVSVLAAEYLENGDILASYEQKAREQIVGIVLSMGASALLVGAPVAAIGAGAVGLVSAAATVSLYMASDIYSYVAWAGMRYGWSTRYSMRLYEQLFG